MIYENNEANIRGAVTGTFAYDHETFGEKFYMAQVKVKRLSDTYDVIPVMASEKLIDTNRNYDGEYINISGQFRSYNKHIAGKSRLILSVFANNVEICGENDTLNLNEIYLNGCICKKPTLRETPRGREISDVLLAVNRQYGKSDYIPCVFWGRNAHFVSKMEIGVQCQINGRIQSREYLKKVSETQFEKRTAYEISVGSVVVEID